MKSRTKEVALILMSLPAFASGEAPSPPVARVEPKQLTNLGDTRVDNYYWLRDKKSPEVTAYLEAENKYTEAVMKPVAELEQRLYKEMIGRIKETDLTVPAREGGYFYYTRTEKGKQYRIHCRRKGSLAAKEEVLLDANALAEGHKTFLMGAFRVSPDHRLLAYSTNFTGDEKFTVFVKDLATGKILDDRIPNATYGVEWAADNRTLFYVTLDEAMRPYKLFRHELGTSAQNDPLVYHEPDEHFNISISKTKSKQYLLLGIESAITTEIRYRKADEPAGEFQVIEPRRADVEYDVAHHGGDFYIRVNDTGRNFRLVKAPVDNPSKPNWREVLPLREDVSLDGVEAFRDYLVVYERAKGLRKIRIQKYAGASPFYVSFQEPAYAVFPAANPEFNTDVLRFTYTSLVTPNSVFDYDMDTRRRVLKKREPVLGGYDPRLYRSERIFAAAADGEKVPISLVYRKGLVKNGGNPALLYGYGSYGINSEPAFSSDRLSLLDRGFVFAIAHIRGGGEMGKRWHDAGKLLHKKNTFTDFIACAERLIADKYTSPGRLSILGGSAGGLLMGAVVNMRPDLFRAVVAKVPFVDVVTTELDASLPGTVTEWEEWGDPSKPEYYSYIRSYSPYDNVEAKAYPHMLVTTGLNDPRVSYWEPAKWVARMRAVKRGENMLLLKTNMGSGHFGASGRYDRLKDTAFDFAFLIHALGLH